MRRTLVIGAGIAGLTLARRLSDRGASVTVLEKSRGVGGRMSTRRTGGVRFDHGAQYFTASASHFVAELDHWLDRELAARWRPRVAQLALHDRLRPSRADTPTRPWFVGSPTMNAPLAWLGRDLDVRNQTCAVSIEGGPGRWYVVSQPSGGGASTDREGPFDAIFSTAPAPQSAALIGAHAPDMAAALGRVEAAPCWAVLLRPGPGCADPGVDVLTAEDGPLAWASNMASRPGRPSMPAWVLHASAAFSREHVERPAADVAAHLIEAFERWVGPIDVQVTARARPSAGAEPTGHAVDADGLQPGQANAHRWRYARVVNPLPGPLWDPVRRLGVAGDAVAGARVEAAFLSALAVVDAIERAP